MKLNVKLKHETQLFWIDKTVPTLWCGVCRELMVQIFDYERESERESYEVSD